jgi:hypothetical protein
MSGLAGECLSRPSQKPSLWIKAQPAFVGVQGKTVIDPDFDIDDDGLPQEKVVLPVDK